MSKEHGKFRHTTDYLGITKPKNRPRHVVWSKAWWIDRIGFAVFILVILFLVRLFVQ